MAGRHSIGALEALKEWALAVAPVAVYVLCEHLFNPNKIHESIFASAEWGIATAFLAIMTVFLLLKDLPAIRSANFQPQDSFPALLALIVMFLLLGAYTVSVLILVESARPENQKMYTERSLVVTEWSFFIIVSALYFWLKQLVERCKSEGH
jgi:hypothetical protein